MRHQNDRPLNRRNTYYVPSFYTLDAGVSWDFSFFRVGVMARNLTDSRHLVTESEIGDGQYYVATPRRFLGEVSFRF
jgi:outer membrane receptor protein involved in Fe transport